MVNGSADTNISYKCLAKLEPLIFCQLSKSLFLLVVTYNNTRFVITSCLHHHFVLQAAPCCQEDRSETRNISTDPDVFDCTSRILKNMKSPSTHFSHYTFKTYKKSTKKKKFKNLGYKNISRLQAKWLKKIILFACHSKRSLEKTTEITMFEHSNQQALVRFRVPPVDGHVNVCTEYWNVDFTVNKYKTHNIDFPNAVNSFCIN
jgi:hypothetical protein